MRPRPIAAARRGAGGHFHSALVWDAPGARCSRREHWHGAIESRARVATAQEPPPVPSSGPRARARARGPLLKAGAEAAAPPPACAPRGCGLNPLLLLAAAWRGTSVARGQQRRGLNDPRRVPWCLPAGGHPEQGTRRGSRVALPPGSPTHGMAVGRRLGRVALRSGPQRRARAHNTNLREEAPRVRRFPADHAWLRIEMRPMPFAQSEVEKLYNWPRIVLCLSGGLGAGEASKFPAWEPAPGEATACVVGRRGHHNANLNKLENCSLANFCFVGSPQQVTQTAPVRRMGKSPWILEVFCITHNWACTFMQRQTHDKYQLALSS